MTSAYNPKHKQDNETESPGTHGKCPAQNCPLPASLFLDGGPWCCTYHAKAPRFYWDDITQMLIKNLRLIKMVSAANSLNCHEFDQIQQAKSWALDEMIMPVKGENHRHWVLRIKETVHKAIKSQVNKIIESQQVEIKCETDGIKNASWAVGQLTNGAFLKKHKTKSREQQLKEIKEKQQNHAA